jgi:hypothetical protein
MKIEKVEQLLNKIFSDFITNKDAWQRTRVVADYISNNNNKSYNRRLVIGKNIQFELEKDFYELVYSNNHTPYYRERTNINSVQFEELYILVENIVKVNSKFFSEQLEEEVDEIINHNF